MENIMFTRSINDLHRLNVQARSTQAVASCFNPLHRLRGRRLARSFSAQKLRAMRIRGSECRVCLFLGCGCVVHVSILGEATSLVDVDANSISQLDKLTPMLEAPITAHLGPPRLAKVTSLGWSSIYSTGAQS